MQAVAPRWAQVFMQSQSSKEGIKIKCNQCFGRLAIKRNDDDGCEPLDQLALAVGSQIDVRAVSMQRYPDSALAAVDEILFDAILIGKRRQLGPKVHDVPVPVFPVIEKGKRLFDVAQCWQWAWHSGHDIAPLTFSGLGERRGTRSDRFQVDPHR
jgi:hypothetical protein